MNWLFGLFPREEAQPGLNSSAGSQFESRRGHMLETLVRDLRYGAQLMRRSPGFTAITVLTLTLGIGANTAIFSVVNGVLLSPLPYSHPEQLISLYESKPNFPHGSISYLNFRDWQKSNATFSSMALFRNYSFSLTGRGDAEEVPGVFVTSDFLSLLDVTPTVGRNFRQGQDEIGAAPVALISASLWQRKFSSAADVLRQSVTLDGRAYDIVGVVPESSGLNAIGLSNNSHRSPDVYVPIGQWDESLLKNRAAGLGIYGIGRLRLGVSEAQARADMDHVARDLEAAYPDDNKGTGASLISLRQKIVGDVQPFLLLLLGAVGFVLLIACVNVANLMLARSISRSREFALRIALGATTGRIVRQLLTESVLLGMTGGALGLLLAKVGTSAMLKTLPATVPRADQIGLDAPVLIFTCVASVFAGLLFGLVPAWKISRPDVLSRLKVGSPKVSRGNNRTQSAFVVAEVAMAVVLLIGAGLMLRSLTQLWKVDSGFDSHSVLTVSVALPPSMNAASPDAIRTAFHQIEDQLQTMPTVEATSVSWGSFPLGWDDEEMFWLESEPKPPNPRAMKWAVQYEIGPGYLKAMGITLLRGRFFNNHDDKNAPQVIVVDEVFAQKFFPNENAVGKRINLTDANGPNPLAEIVGVVRHVRQWGLDSDDRADLRAQIYRSFLQLPDEATSRSLGATGLVVRAKGDTTGAFDSIRKRLQAINAEMVIYNPQTMDAIMAASLAQRQFSMLLLSAFAVLALTLASIGIYGVISYIVGQRTQEIGIRMALGARRIHVFNMVLGQGARHIFLGVAAGLVAAAALTRLMAALLYGVSPTDPLTFGGVSVLLIFVALMACLVPVRRAIDVDPLAALRRD